MVYILPDRDEADLSQKAEDGDSSTNLPLRKMSDVERDEMEQWQRKLTMDEVEEQEEASTQLTPTHYFFLVVSIAALLCITVFMPLLEPVFGHASCISLSVVALAFGSGFMTRDEFLGLDWDLLMLVGGTNVMAFMVRETGLGAELSAKLLGSDTVAVLPYWSLLAVLLLGTVVVSTTAGHTLTGVLLLPLVVALGLKLEAPEMPL